MSKAGIAVYDDAFFDAQVEGSLRSARVIVPIVVKLLRPRSVIDIGCGRGAWLRAFEENGVEQVWGVDGHYVDRSKLLVHPTKFLQIDLRRPFRIEERYDLALCLEVAEHLTSKTGRNLVRTLTGLAPIILFSAAIPGQGGNCHINEQWPSYWMSLFAEHAFLRLDPIRQHIWNDPRVEWWYRQNIFLYASRQAISESPRLQAEERAAQALECIHPLVLDRWTTVRGLLGEIPRAVHRAIQLRLQPRRRTEC